MTFKANLKEAFANLQSTKQRTLLALIGIVVGIGSVIAMVSVGAIVQNEAMRQFMDLGTNIITISKSFYRGERPDSRNEITVANVLDIPKYCPAIETVAPYYTGYQKMSFQGKEEETPAIGLTSSFWDVNKLAIAEGRYIHQLDGGMFYCVLGHELAEKLYKAGLKHPIGERIVYNGKYLTIVGVLENAPMGAMRPYEINPGLLVHIDTYKQLFKDSELETIMAKIATGADNTEASYQVKHYYENLNGTAIEIRSAEELIANMQKQMQLFTLLLGAVGSISLVVGGVGVMNVMLVSVTERTREIGIRRALGAKQSDIQLLFLTESVMLCIMGGILGMGLGVTIAYLIAMFAKWQFTLSLVSIVLGTSVALLTGLFFGIYPARQAAKLNPITALRSE